MKRIEFLRNQVFENLILSNEFYYLFYKNYEQNANLIEEERYGEAFYYALTNLTPSIIEGELVVGNRNVQMTPEQLKEWEDIYKPIAEARSDKAGGGQDSHMSIDYELLLAKGVNGIIGQINTYLKDCDESQKAFYNCCKRCLEGVIKHSEAYSLEALRLSQQTNDPKRKEELLKIAEICKKVPAQPAETFYEAVQSVNFITHCISFNPLRVLYFQIFQLGHPDRYLLPFYEKDIEKGEITKEYAQLLLDCLGIQINMRVPNSISAGYMLGGRTENGEIVANELTEMCLQVIDDIRLIYPAVGLCYTEDMPEKYLNKSCELLLKGHSHPAIFNDDIIKKGLMYYGVPKAQAHNYIHSACVEITPVAASNVWVATPYTNMPQILLDIMDKEYASFDALMQRYFETLDAGIKTNFEEANETRAVRNENSMNPLLSCFVNDCLERGADIERGGAKYNWIMPSFIGIANLVDSLYAIKSLVFEEKKITICKFKTILENNFKDNEDLRQYILNRLPKYGNDIDDVDSYFGLITEHITLECEKYRSLHSNANLIPSAFCWIKHEEYGRETIATPDGRKANFPLGDGSGPCQGREMNGPTASVLSSTKWDHFKFIGGVAVNIKFSKAALGKNSLNTMKSIIKTYIKRGGFEVQINVVDNETLKKAQKNPEEYRDLIVRIGGYSDYFVRLSPEMQEEVILRTTHHV